MSNYNTQLQSNNTDLQTVLQTLQTKAAGTQLPELANEGTAVDLLANKELIGSDGNKITGSMPNNGSINSTMDGINTKNISIPAGYTSGGTIGLDDTIDTEVNTQADLIAQIQAAVDELPEADNGGNNVITNVLVKNRYNNTCEAYDLNTHSWINVTTTGVLIGVNDTLFVRNIVKIMSVPYGQLYKNDGTSIAIRSLAGASRSAGEGCCFFLQNVNPTVTNQRVSVNPKDVDYISLEHQPD